MVWLNLTQSLSCLEVGPNLIPKLFDILVQFKSHAIVLTADIEKAFLMIGIVPADRDTLRFFCGFKIFPRLTVPFYIFASIELCLGLKPSPAILGSVIQHHLNKYNNEHPELVKQISGELYVDDLVTGTDSVDEAFQVYLKSKQLMKKGGLNLRKWSTNPQQLSHMINQVEFPTDKPPDGNTQTISEEEQTYAQSCTSLFNSEEGEKCQKLLGILWDHKSDDLLVDCRVMRILCQRLSIPYLRSVPEYLILWVY